MRMSRLGIRVGAPAVVVLATVVNAAVAGDQLLAAAESQAPDLSWALKGGATPCVRGARAYLAQKAATTIHSLDWLSGALPASSSVCALLPAVPRPAPAPVALSRLEQPAHSTHQHSAP